MLNAKLVKIRTYVLLVIALLLYPTVLLFSIVSVVSKCLRPKSRKCIANEVALVTGGGNGLGKIIAQKLAAKGCHIAVVDIDEEAAIATAKHLAETYDVKAQAFKADISKYEVVHKLSKDVEDKLGPVTVLVNNAGILTFSSFINPPPSEVENMVNVNILAHLWTVQVFLDKMKELGRGHIVGIASVAGVLTCPRQMHYSATKFAVHGFMTALRNELYFHKCDFIKTTTVLPFFLTTNAKVADIIERSGVHSLYPSVTGDEAADAIIEGILTNELEVYIPNFICLAYRLLQLLPKEWQSFIITRLTESYFSVELS